MRRFTRRSFRLVKERFAHQISITSLTAAGRSTLLQRLKRTFAGTPYRFVSGGEMMRRRAQELDMTIEEFARFNREHPEDGHDRWCDDEIARMAKLNWLIGEGRLTHIFMPRAFHVLLTCPVQERARRRHAQLRAQLGRKCPRYEKVVVDILRRDDDDAARYEEMYPGCMWKPEDFDAVIDTKAHDEAEVENIVHHIHRQWLAELTEKNIIRRAA